MKQANIGDITWMNRSLVHAHRIKLPLPVMWEFTQSHCAHGPDITERIAAAELLTCNQDFLARCLRIFSPFYRTWPVHRSRIVSEVPISSMKEFLKTGLVTLRLTWPA